MDDKKIMLKTVSSMEKILPCKEPTELENGNVMLSNERFHFQIALKNNTPGMLKMLKARITGLDGEYITVRTAELVPGGYFFPNKDDYYISKEPGLFPDLLRPISKKGVVIPRAQWCSLFVTVHSETGIPAGKYSLNIEILDGETLIDGCEYSLEVRPERLPETDLLLTNWMHYDCIAHQHNVSPFSDGFYTVFEKYLREYTLCGNNMLLTPLFTPPLDTVVGGERETAQLVDVEKTGTGYVFSFEKLKYFIRFVMERGIKYIEFNHLFTQWGGECCPKIMAHTENGYEKIFGWETKSSSDEYRAFLDAFLPELMKVTEELGVTDKCYFHLTDEPHIDHLETYKMCHGMVKKHIGSRPIMDAISNYDFYEKGLIDLPVPETSSFPSFKEHNVSDLMVYYCCNPCDNYYSNRALSMPLQRTRILGWQLYESGVRGFLHWGFNFYNTAYSYEPVDPYADTSAGGMFPSGDSFIVYPAADDVWSTLRAESIGEAMQDYRLCRLLEAKIGKAGVQEILRSFGIEGYNKYPRSVSAHKDVRKKLIEGLNG